MTMKIQDKQLSKDKAFRNFKNSRKEYTKEEALKNKSVKDFMWTFCSNENDLDFDKIYIYKTEEADIFECFYLTEKKSNSGNFHCFVDRWTYSFSNLEECEKRFFGLLEEYLGDEIIEEFVK